MTTSQLHDPQCSYSQHLCPTNRRQMPQVYIVNEAPYLELSMLEGHQPWSMTSFIPMSSTDLTENDAQHTFKAPCCCFANAPNTDLLFFEQSM